MPEQFLHGVEVLELDGGPRPIATVKSAVIGIVGTAPDSEPGVAASLLTGIVASNNALTWTAKAAGIAGNAASVALLDPAGNNKALTVSVVDKAVTVSLATSDAGAITSTATDVIAAVAASAPATALLTVAKTAGSSGAGVVTAAAKASLSGGVDEPFPLNVPTLVAGSRVAAAKLGTTGTLPAAMDAIFDQAGAVVIVVRVAPGVDEAATMAAISGGVDGNGKYTGAQAFIGAESLLGFAPRILIAPGFTHQRPDDLVNVGMKLANPVVSEMIGIAQRLRAVIIADGPNTTDADAIAYAGDFGSSRVYLVDPWVQRQDASGAIVLQPGSAVAAGLICYQDNANGFWWSPSNQTINGIVGVGRPVDFSLGDASARANLLNEKNVTTIIRQNGFRLWGNRTLSADPKWAFLSVRRTADIIHDSLLRAHLWAVDRNITKTYIEDVVEGVNAYLRDLVKIGAILGGKCWADPDLNSPAQLAAGKAYFDFDFTAPSPAEHITFRSHMVDDYLKEIFA